MKNKSNTPASTTSTPSSAREAWWLRLAPLWIALVALAAFSNGARGVFVFDDHIDITDNVAIREPWPPWRVIIDQGQSGVSGRPVVALSYALNHEWCGYETWGWHWVNVAIHALTALAVFGCVRRALRSAPCASSWGGSATAIALAVAAMFAAHPLSTGVVMYRGQRVESMMAMFFAATMYCALRAFAEPERKWWPRLAVLACALGTGCKEVIVGAPVLVLLYDAMFVSRSWKAALSTRKLWYASLFGTWLLIAMFVVLAEGRSESVGFGYSKVGPWQYLTTQAWAVPHYLRLAVFPHPLVFDYGVEPIVETSRWMPGGVIVLGLLAATVFGIWKRSAFGFLGAWWFVILAPSSSILPIVTEIIVEHRAYLPTAAVLLALALIVASWLRRLPSVPRAAIGTTLTVIAVASGVALTRARNQVYHAEIDVWADTVAKLPNNHRAHASYGNDLRVAGRIAEAGEHYAEAVRLAPDDPYWRANYGTWLMGQNRLDEGIAELERSRELLPTFGMTLENLGRAYASKGRPDQALEVWNAALEIGSPAVAYVAQQVHLLFTQRGQEAEALGALRKGLRWSPNDPELLVITARALLEAKNPTLRAPNDAYTFAQRSFALTRNTDPRSLDLAAEALVLLERRAEAEQVFQQAAAVWGVLGRTAEAETSRRRAQEIAMKPR